MKRKILIVDDDETLQRFLRDVLEEEGYELVIVPSGEECIARFPEFRPHVVLCDVSLPGISGYETCRRIGTEPGNETVLVVLMSGRTGTEDKIRGYAVGALDYLTKPFDPRELVAKLRAVFRLEGAMKALGEARAAVQKHNTKLEQLVRARTAEIVATRDVTVFALAKLAESRDPETGEHLERMCRYTRILGEELSINGPYTDLIDEYFLEDLYRSCPLHDIGKVGIPDVILLKPGRLTKEEFEVMKTHTTIGAEALESSMSQTSATFLAMAAEIARCHHERYDGRGYPAGLKGDRIPIAARIVALADMFDALTSPRVYKRAYDPELARTLILKEEGKHFDPAVVRAFRATFPDFLEVLRFFGRDGDDHVSPEDTTAIREIAG